MRSPSLSKQYESVRDVCALRGVGARGVGILVSAIDQKIFDYTAVETRFFQSHIKYEGVCVTSTKSSIFSLILFDR